MEKNRMETACFNRFHFEIPNQSVDECSHRGDCSIDVNRWHNEVQLSHITDEELTEELKEYGAWECFGDRVENEKKIIWIAACNIQEEKEQKDDGK